MLSPKLSPLERFNRQYQEEPNCGCWLWTGVAGGMRYGRMNIDKRAVPAHRAAWQLLIGPIPDGKIVCHRCDNTWCVNPQHLFLGTHRDNTQDMLKKGRGRHQRSALDGRDAHVAGDRRRAPPTHDALDHVPDVAADAVQR